MKNQIIPTIATNTSEMIPRKTFYIPQPLGIPVVETYKDIYGEPAGWGLKYVPSHCLHDGCPDCRGTGYKTRDGSLCVHGIACPCPKCSFMC